MDIQSIPSQPSSKDKSVKHGIVLYADGGAKPNPGHAGYGVHGYHYDVNLYAKPIGLGSIVASTLGYKPKEEVKEGSTTANKVEVNIDDLKNKKDCVLVSPTKYVDMFGTVGKCSDDLTIIETASNNHAEVKAAIMALKYVLKEKPDYVSIQTDSQYVVRGINEFLPGIIKRNWNTSEGVPIKNLNAWQELSGLLNEVKAADIPVAFSWLKGHNDNTGNERADKLATMGRFTATRGKDHHVIETKQPEGFWKYSTEKHPFVSQRHCYFNTLLGANVPGEYFLGDHGKDNELFGKKISDTTFSVIRLKEPDPIIELIRDVQSTASLGADILYVAYLDKIFNASTHQDLNTYGELIITRANQHRLDLMTIGDIPITYEFNPPRLAWRSVDSLLLLSDVLDKFISSGTEISVTKITDVFYDKTTKTPKVKKTKKDTIVDPIDTNETAEIITKLKSEFNVGCASVKIQCQYKSEQLEGNTEITLALGIDLLDRNALKRLEDKNPEIYCVIWFEGSNLFRYATIIKAGEDIGIWASVSSNLKVIV